MKNRMRKICILLTCLTLGLSNVMTAGAVESDLSAYKESTVQNVETEGNPELSITDEETGKDNPEADDPEADDSETDDPGVDDSETDDPEVDDPEADDPEVDDPETELPEVDVPIYEELDLEYQAHVQRIGWQEWKKSGEDAGTEGESLRVEAIKIRVNDAPYEGDIEYRVHVQKIGWQEWKKNGELAGTEGESLRIEAIQIRLTGELAEHYSVTYQTHAANFGWLGIVNSDELSGTEGFGKRLECIRINAVPVDEVAESTERGYVKAYPDEALTYSGHVQKKGGIEPVTSGEVLGTTGEKLRIEGFIVNLDDTIPNVLKGSVEYRAHVQTYGWLEWMQEGEYAGTQGESKRVEAIQIKLTGEAEKYYNIYYRCHVQNAGWLGWASNGASAGTAKLGWRIEALQIQLVPKGMSAPGDTSNCYMETKTGWFYESGYKFYYKDGKKMTDVRSILGQQSVYEIRINKQMSCVTAYAKDGDNGFIIPVVAFACSPGKDTPVGTFYTSDKYRWHELYGAMGQWCTRITGHILFHSPPYSEFNNRTLWPKEYNKLGSWASQGCIRLRSGDAKWIYDYCQSPTKVIIYNSSNAGPLGKPVYAKIPLSQTWDPTDPTV